MRIVLQAALIGLSLALSLGVQSKELTDATRFIATSPASDAIEFKSTKKFQSAEYCPDNTCEVVRAPGSVSDAEFKKFYAAYLFYVSSYNYLINWRADDKAQSQARHILSALKGNSCGPGSADYVKCSLKAFIQKNGVTGSFVRHDEGTKGATAFSPLEEVAKLK
ncbi:hypothetical protein [Lysobacter capsici]|uniref:hypothetical protein n=1 Tax=Lysobacter capsici TaxID=435897 RepID=UPI0012FDA045|nr:hypothetical protein [Lysobacter capsici]